MPSSIPLHGADRDGHFLAAPEVTFLEEYVGHMMIVRCDDQALLPVRSPRPPRAPAHRGAPPPRPEGACPGSQPVWCCRGR